MATLNEPQFVTIQKSGTVSDHFGARNATVHGIWAPVVDSCNVLIRTSYDSTSENFVQAMDSTLTDNSASSAYDTNWKWAVAGGSKSIILQSGISAFPFGKIETSVAQTDIRTFAVLIKFG